MEPTLGTGLGDLAAFIVWPYLLIFILLSYLIKKNFSEILQKITPWEWKPVYTVLVLATVVGIPYGIFGDVNWIQIVITYALGTSFYELILDAVIKGVTKLINKVFNSG